MKKPGVAKSEEGKGISTILISLFRSLKLTIFLLILLAVVSIIGTLITQNATPEEYIQRYGVSLYEVLHFFGLFDMYHSWWFSAILLFLVINLVACSAQRIPGIWNQTFRVSPAAGLEESMLERLPYSERIRIDRVTEDVSERGMRVLLKNWFRNGRNFIGCTVSCGVIFGPLLGLLLRIGSFFFSMAFGIFLGFLYGSLLFLFLGRFRMERFETSSAITLYAEKGRLSRLGVTIAHLSVLIILIGGLIGSQLGFRGFVNIFEGETIDRIYLRGRNGEISKPLDFSVRCDDFKIVFYDLPGKQKHVKEYLSVLTILENGKEVAKETIKVNHPLHYKGLAFYQSNYGTVHDATLGLQWKDRKEKILIKVSEREIARIPNSNILLQLSEYLPDAHGLGEGVVLLAFLPPNRPLQEFVLFKDPSRVPQPWKEAFVLNLEGVTTKEYTGLQVTKDPGVWIVWLGSLLMVLGGFVVSFFFSHQKIWIRIPDGLSGGEIILGGSTNKNRIGFEKTFSQLADEVRSAVRG